MKKHLVIAALVATMGCNSQANVTVTKIVNKSENFFWLGHNIRANITHGFKQAKIENPIEEKTTFEISVQTNPRNLYYLVKSTEKSSVVYYFYIDITLGTENALLCVITQHLPLLGQPFLNNEDDQDQQKDTSMFRKTYIEDVEKSGIQVLYGHEENHKFNLNYKHQGTIVIKENGDIEWIAQ